MSLAACADLVQRADPDRFLASMAAPPPARAVLLPVHAFNVEISRAPWVTKEPMIAEMRLQWWRDALEEIFEGRQPRAHEVVTPLAGILPRALDLRPLMMEMIDARRWDIDGSRIETAEQLERHIDQTAGHHMWVSARLLGASVAAEPVVRRFARGAGMAAWLRSVPDWRARGRQPLPDETPEAIAGLARGGLADLKAARDARDAAGGPGGAAMLSGWRAGHFLRQAAAAPETVLTGLREEAEFRRRGMLLLRALSGRW
jgi:phytoene/squalene synthetase